MRVTDSMRLAAVSTAEERSAEALLQATESASTGLSVSEPSDDPVAYASITSENASIAQISSRKDALGSAANDLSLADDTLASASDLIVRAQQIALDMSNGDQDAPTRAQEATEVDGIRSDLVGLANTQSTRGYIFGGSATGTPPFTQDGAFVGNDDVVGVEVADGTVAASNASGAKAFTAAGGVDVFQTLADLSTALSSNSQAGVQGTIDALAQSRTQIVAERSETGLMSTRISSAANVTSTSLVQLQTALASDSQADPVEAYSNLAQAQAAYQRNVDITSKILSLSVVNPAAG